VNLLTHDNRKLGRGIFSFNLPAVRTCPGATPRCLALCYARRGHWCWPSVREGLRRRLEASRGPDFVGLVSEELRHRHVQVLRLHASGDFYAASYVRRWLRILRRCPEVRAYAYTRCWRVARLRRALEELAALPNVRLWYSVDADSGLPAGLPPGVCIAWMQSTRHEPAPAGATLAFRVHALRAEPAPRLGLALVCPTERGGTHGTTCTTCKFCWQP
jgi:hypothetical protein